MNNKQEIIKIINFECHINVTNKLSTKVDYNIFKYLHFSSILQNFGINFVSKETHSAILETDKYNTKRRLSIKVITLMGKDRIDSLETLVVETIVSPRGEILRLRVEKYIAPRILPRK